MSSERRSMLSRRFPLVAAAALLAILLFIGVQAVMNGTGKKSVTDELPQTMLYRRYEYPSIQARQDDAIMGIRPLRVEMEALKDDGKVILRYGGIDTQVRVTRTYSIGNLTCYTLTPPNKQDQWKATIWKPSKGDIRTPEGTWLFEVVANDGSWAHSEWCIFRSDGTATIGGGEVAATKDAANNAQYEHEGTWRVSEANDGVLISIDYQVPVVDEDVADDAGDQNAEAEESAEGSQDEGVSQDYIYGQAVAFVSDVRGTA